MNFTKDAWLVPPNQQQAYRAVSATLLLLQMTYERFARAWAVRRQRANDAATLNEFSDRDLWDLGLSRSDIPGIVRGTYQRD